MEDLRVGPSVAEGQDIEMVHEGNIPEVAVQGEEDVPNTEENRVVDTREGVVEEEVPTMQVLSIDEILGEISKLKFLLAYSRSLLNQALGDNESVHAQFEHYRHYDEDRLRYKVDHDHYRHERDTN